MQSVERTALIEAPVGVVWGVLADFASISAWAANVDHSCLLTEQSSGIDTVRRIQTGRTTLRETVETWEPETELSYRIDGLPSVVISIKNTWRLDAAGDSTNVTLTSDINCGPRPPQQLIAKVVGRQLAAASEQMIAGLTTTCEAQQGVAL